MIFLHCAVPYWKCRKQRGCGAPMWRSMRTTIFWAARFAVKNIAPAATLFQTDVAIVTEWVCFWQRWFRRNFGLGFRRPATVRHISEATNTRSHVSTIFRNETVMQQSGTTNVYILTENRSCSPVWTNIYTYPETVNECRADESWLAVMPAGEAGVACANKNVWWDFACNPSTGVRKQSTIWCNTRQNYLAVSFLQFKKSHRCRFSAQ